METETPLLDLLASVPEGGRAIVETGINSYDSIPYGKLCRAARDEIVRLNQELVNVNTDCSIACSESYILGWTEAQDALGLPPEKTPATTGGAGWEARMPVIEALAKDIIKLHRPDAEGAD